MLFRSGKVMNWPWLFGVTNLVAVIGWALLLFAPRRPGTYSVILFGGVGLLCLTYATLLVLLVGGLIIDCLALLREPARIPWREISANVYRTGTQALGITALVGFLVGVVLSYLSSQQLKLFGADIFIINKADRKGVEETRRDVEQMLELSDLGHDDWRPPVLTAVATENKGIAELWSTVLQHREFVEASGELARRREFVRVRLDSDMGVLLHPHQGSGVLSSAAWSDGLVDLAPQQVVQPGDTVAYWPVAELMQPAAHARQETA